MIHGIYQYENYEEYVAAQTEANILKLDWVWATKSTMVGVLNAYSKTNNRTAKTVLCHGSRNGRELEFLLDHEPSLRKVLGTDISYTADRFDNQVVWDFHERNEEWVGAWDIVYSNSLDHAYDPEKALLTWYDQLTPGGLLCIDHAHFFDNDGLGAGGLHKWDCWKPTHEELISLIKSLGWEISRSVPWKEPSASGFSKNPRFDSRVYYIFKE